MQRSTEVALQLTRRWLEIMVIGHDLCPFAKWPYEHNLVRLELLPAQDKADILVFVRLQLQELDRTSASELETTLLILPDSSMALLDWNEINLDVNDMIAAEGWSGIYQSVMFHPEFAYGGEDPHAVINVTNRSPLPLLHIIREESINRVIDDGYDTQAIIDRNSQHLNDLGWQGWGDVQNKIHKS